jgi:hypothetical protein
VTGKQLRGLGAFECGHPHLEPEDRCDIREGQFTKGWGKRYDDWGVDIEVGCGEEVNKSGRRAWRADHVTTTSNADDLYWTSATADCYIITLYSGSRLLMNCGKGECNGLVVLNANVLTVADSRYYCRTQGGKGERTAIP